MKFFFSLVYLNNETEMSLAVVMFVVYSSLFIPPWLFKRKWETTLNAIVLSIALTESAKGYHQVCFLISFWLCSSFHTPPPVLIFFLLLWWFCVFWCAKNHIGFHGVWQRINNQRQMCAANWLSTMIFLLAGILLCVCVHDYTFQAEWKQKTKEI